MRDSEQTKKRILAAAMDEFADKGFAGTRVDEIGRRAGVNKAVIYYYFENKENLFDVLFRTEMDELKRKFTDIMQGDPGSLEKSVSMMRNVLKYMESKEKYLRVLMSASILSQPAQTQFFELLDLSTDIGVKLAQKRGNTDKVSKEDSLLNELFNGLLPVIYFVILRGGLQRTYGFSMEELTDKFITGWLSQSNSY